MELYHGAKGLPVLLVEDGRIVLGADPSRMDFERSGNNLLLHAEGAPSAVIEDFFVAQADGVVTEFVLPDGTVVDGMAFLQTQNGYLDLSTAAGPDVEFFFSDSASEYRDNGGDLLDGVDRLSALDSLALAGRDSDGGADSPLLFSLARGVAAEGAAAGPASVASERQEDVSISFYIGNNAMPGDRGPGISPLATVGSLENIVLTPSVAGSIAYDDAMQAWKCEFTGSGTLSFTMNGMDELVNVGVEPRSGAALVNDSRLTVTASKNVSLVDLDLNGGAGFDSIHVAGSVLSSWDSIGFPQESGPGARIAGGAGDDGITLHANYLDQVQLHAGDGNNMISVDGASVPGGLHTDGIMRDTAIVTGSGNDSISVTVGELWGGSLDGAALRIEAGGGDDHIDVSVREVKTGPLSAINTGAGDDLVSIQGDIKGFTLNGAHGDDTLVLRLDGKTDLSKSFTATEFEHLELDFSGVSADMLDLDLLLGSVKWLKGQNSAMDSTVTVTVDAIDGWNLPSGWVQTGNEYTKDDITLILQVMNAS